jgi:hypothetical protein
MMFKQVQQEFMDYIRDPSQPLPAGIEPRRMKIYRDLFFNNISGFISSAFPVLKSLYSSAQWQALVQAFFVHHDCQSPIFVEIAGEFLQFLQTEYQPNENDPVFLLELAHYEWLELAVAVTKDDESLTVLSQNEISTASLSLNVTAKVAQYAFDVQHISVDYQPIAPTVQAQFFCVYRDDVDEVAFLKLTPLSAQVLAYIEQNQPCSFNALCEWLLTLYPTMAKEALYQGCMALLGQLVEKHIIGHKKAQFPR